MRRMLFAVLSGLVMVLSLPLSAGAVPIVDADMTDAVVVGGDPANPGDTLEYTILITNLGIGDATGLVFSVGSLDSETTLVGSIIAYPIAVDDDYTVGIAAAFDLMTIVTLDGLLANDIDPDDTTTPGSCTNCTVVEVSSTMDGPMAVPATIDTNQGGSVTVESDGSFAYSPPAGFVGSDSFKYLVEDGGGNSDEVMPNETSVGTVGILIVNRAFFVKNDNASAGDGSIGNPFKLLSAAVAAANATGDLIFVFHGDGTTTNLDTAVGLLPGQTLMGQGVNLDVVIKDTANNMDVITLVTGNSGLRPTITNTSGNAVTLAKGNTVKGLNIGTGNPVVGDGILGGSDLGTVTIDEVSIVTNGGSAIDLTGDGNDVLDVSLGSVTADGGGADDGIRVTGFVSGSFAVTGSTFIGGTTSPGGDGIHLSSNGTATFTFADVDVDTSDNNTVAVFASNSGTVTSTGGTLNSGTASAVDIDNTALAMTFTSVTSTGGSSPGIDLATTTGSFTVTGDGSTATLGGNDSGGIIQNKSGDGIVLNTATNITLRNMTIGDPSATPADSPDATNNIATEGIDATAVTGLSLFNVTIARTGSHGVKGTNVTNLTLEDSLVLNAGDGNEEHGLALTELRGDNFVTDSLFDAFNETGIEVSNASGSVDLTVTDTTFQDNQATVGDFGQEGILLDASGTATMTVLIKSTDGTSCVFDTLKRQGVDAVPVGSSTINLTVDDCDFGDTDAADGAVKVNIDATANANVTIKNNRFTETAGDSVFLKNDSQGTLQATIQNNIRTNVTSLGRGISVIHDDAGGAGAANGTTILLIDGNNISNTFFEGIFVDAHETPATGGSPDVSVTITGNTVAAPSAGFGDFFGANAIFIDGREASRVCVDITGNTATGNAAAGIAVERLGGTFQIEGLTGGVAAFIASVNTSTAAASGAFSTVGACPLPAATPLP